MTGQPERPEDKLERLLSGRRGIPLRPEDGAEFAAMSDMADALREAGTQIPTPTRMDAALSRMLAEVERETMNKTTTGGFRTMLAAWWSRPMMRTAMATVAAVTVVSGAGLGAAAAMGQADPVRELLRISSSSAIGVELTGTVVSVDGTTIKVDANGDVRTIIIDDSTKITGGGDNDAPLTIVDIVVGGFVEVHGKLLPDNSIQATRFHLEDDVASPTAAVPTEAASTPGAEPTSGSTPSAGPTEDGDDEGDHEDNSGSGNADDDGDNEDNSGPGSGDDDGANEGNSGPGSGDDVGEDEDNSDFGGADDVGGEDDDSGSGGDDGSDGDAEANSGPGGGVDHE